MKRLQKKNYYDYSYLSNPNSVYVGRPTKWGNPFKEKDYGLKICLEKYHIWLIEQLKENPKFLDPLKGKDLVCFCKLNRPCHADIIIEFLNEEVEKLI